MNRQPLSEADLHAYVDGVLPEGRRTEVNTYLVARPDEALRLRAYRDQNQALKAHFAAVLDEPVPNRLLEAAVAASPSSFPTTSWMQARWPFGRIAAGFVMALVGGVTGWVARDQWPAAQPTAPAPLSAARPNTAEPVTLATSLPRQAAIAHAVFSPDVRRPVEIGADQEDQLIAWLSKRLGSPVRPPKLGALGFELIGGRLLPGDSGAVAQFMYQDATGQRLTLYVSAENAGNHDTAFRFAQEGPINVFYWIDGKFGYALSAGLGKGDLARLATAVYDQLQPR